MTSHKSAQMHAAKARKRMAEPAPDYPTLIDHTKPVDGWTYTNFVSGVQHDIVVFPSRRRSDAFRFVVDGKERFRSLGYSRFFVWLTRRCAARSYSV